MFRFHNSQNGNSIIWELEKLKPDSYHLPKTIWFICFNESFLKIMKNASYFILKAFFVLKIFRSLSWLFVYAQKKTKTKKIGLIRKIKLISKFMMSQTNTTPTLTNISSKENQTMKFGQVIEYNKRNINL